MATKLKFHRPTPDIVNDKAEFRPGSLKELFGAPNRRREITFIGENGQILRRLPQLVHEGDSRRADEPTEVIEHPVELSGAADQADSTAGETVSEALGKMANPREVRAVVVVDTYGEELKGPFADIDGVIASDGYERRDADHVRISVYLVPQGRTLQQCIAN